MEKPALTELLETAARATINERCASVLLHDVRGTMQALFSAFELLGRSAKLGGENSLRIDKACELARRAIDHHQKATLHALQLFALQPVSATSVDLGELVRTVTHVLRNDAAIKELVINVAATEGVTISAERLELQTLLSGLLAAAIDYLPSGSILELSVSREDGYALLSFGCNAGFADTRNLHQCFEQSLGSLQPSELTLLFARRFLAANGGRLEIDTVNSPAGTLRLYYPCLRDE